MFFTRTGRPATCLSGAISRVFKSLGCGGMTLHKLRHVLATLSWERYTDADRTLVAQHMCHSLAAQEQYYVRLGSGERHLKARSLVERLLRPDIL